MLARLSAPGCLAVMPHLDDQAPGWPLACLAAGLPMVVGTALAPLVPESDRAATCCVPEAGALAARLASAMAKAPTDRPGVGPDEARIAAFARTAGWCTVDRAPMPAGTPLVSVCLSHFNRPGLLAQALASLERQDYPHLEVILVDDGSTRPEAIAYLEALEPRFAARGWRILRQANRYAGAAKNQAARQARGAYLLFMDDDNVAAPHEVTRFVQAARHSGADALTCFLSVFEGDQSPGADEAPARVCPMLGGAVAVGAFRNMLGDMNFMIKREVFEALGGFTEDHGVGHIDWEFLAKLALAGHSLDVVPEPLVWYRASGESILRGGTLNGANMLRHLRPYLAAVPTEMHGVLLLAQGLHESRAPEPSPEPRAPEPSPEPRDPEAFGGTCARSMRRRRGG